MEEETLMQAVLMGQWKAVKNSPDSPIELYNLSDDVGEQNDVSAANYEIVKTMQQIMKREHNQAPPQIDMTASEAKKLYVPKVACAE
jgi:hypothetical protein